jgi:hypothetical protein
MCTHGFGGRILKKNIIKMDPEGIRWVESIGLIWLKIGTNGGHGTEISVSINEGISWLAEVLLASHEGLGCVELGINVSYDTGVSHSIQFEFVCKNVNTLQ